MGIVIPFQRAQAIEQCRQLTLAEALVQAQVELWFAWARDVNRIWWGA